MKQMVDEHPDTMLAFESQETALSTHRKYIQLVTTHTPFAWTQEPWFTFPPRICRPCTAHRSENSRLSGGFSGGEGGGQWTPLWRL